MFNVTSNGIVDISKLKKHKLHSLLVNELLKIKQQKVTYTNLKDSYIYKYLINYKLQWGSEYQTPKFQKHLKTDIMCIRFFEWQSRELFTLTEYQISANRGPDSRLVDTPFENLAIRCSDNFHYFKNQTCLVFRSPLCNVNS